jgi:hypothetical protein
MEGGRGRAKGGGNGGQGTEGSLEDAEEDALHFVAHLRRLGDVVLPSLDGHSKEALREAHSDLSHEASLPAQLFQPLLPPQQRTHERSVPEPPHHLEHHRRLALVLHNPLLPCQPARPCTHAAPPLDYLKEARLLHCVTRLAPSIYLRTQRRFHLRPCPQRLLHFRPRLPAPPRQHDPPSPFLLHS